MAIGVRTVVKTVFKTPGELLIVEIDLSEDMATAETITSQDGTEVISPAGLTVPSVTFSGQKINIHLSGGTNLVTYKVSVVMVTSTTQKLAAALTVSVRVV